MTLYRHRRDYDPRRHRPISEVDFWSSIAGLAIVVVICIYHAFKYFIG